MTIEITGGSVQIDETDFELVSTFTWHVGDTGYAVWRGILDGKKQTVRMHRLITACPRGLIVDHINHDTLDNRRQNLRVCTNSENMRNKRDQGKGYWFQRQTGHWVVDVNRKHVGSFATEEEAQAVVALVRAGGVYVKPDRTACLYGHSLEDAYDYGQGKRCRKCQSIRSKKYFSRSYKAKPRVPVTICPRGHDKIITRTPNGDCRECAIIRSKTRRDSNANASRHKEDADHDT